MHKALEPVVGMAHELDFDIELQEAHHRYKQDAPSGTANAHIVVMLPLCLGLCA